MRKKVLVEGKLPSDFSSACHKLDPALSFAKDVLSGEVLTKEGDGPWRVPDKVDDATHRALFRESTVVVTTKKGKNGKPEQVQQPWAISQKDWSDARAGEAGMNRRNDFEEYVSACEVDEGDVDGLEAPPALCDVFYKGFNCDDTLLNREASTLLMIAMVRRGCLMDEHRNGTWFDYCPILAGPQGTAKTKGLPLLFPPHLRATRTTSNALLMARSEAEFVRSITGMVLAVADEMAGRTRADRDALKARITRASDRVRRLYHDQTEHRVRTAVVCATANPDDTGFIPDDVTGLRRWIPVMVRQQQRDSEPETKTPLQYTKDFFDRWRDHLWALAYAAARENPRLVLSDAAEAEADALRRRHEKQVDAPFVDWLKAEAQTTSRAGIMLDALLFEQDGVTPRTQTAPRSNLARSQALQQAGWQRQQVRVDGKPQRLWVPPVTA